MRSPMRRSPPADPRCLDVKKFREALFGDPMTRAMGAPTGEICEDFDRKHVPQCQRCQEYAAANAELAW